MWDSPRRTESGMTGPGKGKTLCVRWVSSQTIGNAALLVFSGSVLWIGREADMKPELLQALVTVLPDVRTGLTRPPQP